jgi:CRISPR-associated endonuclease Csn1
MGDVPDGFKNSQLVDIGIITKYSRMYLKTVFPKVYTVKGNTVADFRKMWGLQDLYIKKERVNHIHHCIDAITIACMDKSNYETLAKFYHESEDAFLNNSAAKPDVEKPWPTFTEDVKGIEKDVLVSHYTPDNLPKQSKRKLRKRGKIQYNKNGDPILLKGDTVRGSLHKETFYGAIEREIVNKKGEKEKKIKYVVRKSLNDLEDSALKNIVDDQVRDIVINARKKEKDLQKEIDSLVKQRRNAEEWEEANIDSQISQLKQQITDLFSLPNKNGAPVPIRKVRLYQPTITNPIHLKNQRDKSIKSKKEHKEQYHVANDSNYMMAIYEGKNKNGKIKRDFILVNNLDAGKYFTGKLSENPIPEIHPKSKLSFKSLLKTGTMVILWEDKPEEVWTLSKYELKKRSYKITKMNKDGRITLKYHQEARNDESLKQDYEFLNKIKAPKSLTNGESYIDFKNPFPKLLLSPSKFYFLVEGIDFRITPHGKLIKIK